MAEPIETATDTGIGLTLAFGVLAAIGAAVMYAAAPDELAGWGFAAAVVFGVLAIVAVHRY